MCGTSMTYPWKKIFCSSHSNLVQQEEINLKPQHYRRETEEGIVKISHK